AFHLGILGRMLAQVWVTLATIVLLIRYLYREKMISFSFDWKYLKEGFRYALPAIPDTSMAWITCLSDRLLLAFFKLSASVGTYAFGYDLSRLIMSLLSESTFQAYAPLYLKEMTHN